MNTDPIPVLDHGFVRVVDLMGDDSAIVQAARVSYGAGTKTLREDAKLIRYLWDHGHTSPFEMVELKLHIKAPIFVARQWVRHRTASWNEVSGRYSEMDEDYYLPEPDQIRAQSTTNRQGRGEALNHESAHNARIVMKNQCEDALLDYRALLARGVARELARIVLPVAFYTQWYWKIDGNNLLKFLTQRCDEHAQYEIRAYANVIAEIVREWLPATYAAWKGQSE